MPWSAFINKLLTTSWLSFQSTVNYQLRDVKLVLQENMHSGSCGEKIVRVESNKEKTAKGLKICLFC